VLDFHQLEEFEKEGRRMVRLLMVAAQKVMIQQLVASVEAAKLTPVGVDLVPFAIVRSVGSIEGVGVGETPADEAVVDVGADITSICVHAWGVPRFVRILPSGGREVTNALVRSMGVSEEEAEWLKRGEGTLQDANVKQATTVTQTRGAAFADDIRSSLEFYLTQMPGARIGRVLVTGGGSKLPGLLQLLGERLPSEVVAGHSFSRVASGLDMPADAMAEAEPLLAVAVGLALPGVRG
jgi:type IV pilus assembly protein PilM